MKTPALILLTTMKGRLMNLFYAGPDGHAAFTDFEFQADVKTEPESNSGVYFHTEYRENDWPQKGFEIQINSTKKEKRKTGGLYAVVDITEALVRDDEWFHLHVVVRGKRVVIKLDEAAPGESWVNPPKEAIPGVEHRTFQSGSMKRAVGFNIYLPAGYAGSDKRFPVVYYLNGMGNDESSHPQLFGILDKAIRAGEVPPMILVYAMCGRTSFYADSPGGEVMGETVFIKELIPHVDRTVRTIASRDGRAVMGFSMGGAGAVKFACKYPDLFSSAVSFSGGYAPGAVEKSRFPKVFQQMFGDDVKRFDEQSALTLVRTGGGKVPLRICVGTKDVLYEQNQRLKAVLEELKIDFEYEEIEGVAHNPPLVFAAQGLQAFKFHARHFQP